MADVLTPEQRARNMSRIRAKDTKPEMVVRRLLHRLGYRYRLHDKTLPGTPDIVFRGRRRVIFVHGCFWHSHDCRYGTVKPQTNPSFWEQKRLDTMKRDVRHVSALAKAGWQVLTVWECELSPTEQLSDTLQRFLAERD
jgi:DNA mismatch endonuclease, patch repair protein